MATPPPAPKGLTNLWHRSLSAASIRSTIDDLIVDEEAAFLARQPRSRAMSARAAASLAGGATSSWQIARPATVWISHGAGSHVFDVDGTDYVDLHGGYGAMIAGHAHPAVVDAIARRVSLGTHFAQPTDDAIVVAENLAERFGLPLWRFGNSGTEATMDAVHLMRAVTGRDLIIKIEGSYHGHHDAVMVSYYNELDELGPYDRPHSVLAGTGIPQVIADLVRRRPVQRPRRARRRAGRAPRPRRRHDHRADDDERRHRPSRPRLPRRRPPAHPRATACCSRSTR